MPRGDNPNSWRNSVKSADHPRWSDEKIVSSHGYVKIRVGVDHPLADPNGYAYEHLVVWASAGLPLPGPDELLHHKNEVKSDNRLGNLERRLRVDHSIAHQPTALTDAQVKSLREEYAAGVHTGTLSERYRIPIQTAWKLVRGKTRLRAGGPIVSIPLRQAKRLAHNGFPETSHGR